MDPITESQHPLLRQAEPWFQLGTRHEKAGNAILAAHCYYLAMEMQPHRPSMEALRRLGYLNLDANPSGPPSPDSKEQRHGF